eukprot:1382491-Pyramimonas_sp.AAC.1
MYRAKGHISRCGVRLHRLLKFGHHVIHALWPTYRHSEATRPVVQNASNVRNAARVLIEVLT